MSEPIQKPGKSKQDYGTPREFIAACEARFGPIVCDLAASPHNAKCATYITQEEDTFAVDWAERFPAGTLWLNPEFADIEPYAERCAAMASRRHGLILLLTPASIGSNWFARHVNRKAMVLGISPRLQFEGTTAPYPKDLSLSVFGMGLNGFDCWRWKP